MHPTPRKAPPLPRALSQQLGLAAQTSPHFSQHSSPPPPARRAHLVGAPVAQVLLRLFQLVHRQGPVQVVKELRGEGPRAGAGVRWRSRLLPQARARLRQALAYLVCLHTAVPLCCSSLCISSRATPLFHRLTGGRPPLLRRPTRAHPCPLTPVRHVPNAPSQDPGYTAGPSCAPHTPPHPPPLPRSPPSSRAGPPPCPRQPCPCTGRAPAPCHSVQAAHQSTGTSEACSCWQAMRSTAVNAHR